MGKIFWVEFQRVHVIFLYNVEILRALIFKSTQAYSKCPQMCFHLYIFIQCSAILWWLIFFKILTSLLACEGLFSWFKLLCINDIVQNCSISCALAMEILQSWTKLLACSIIITAVLYTICFIRPYCDGAQLYIYYIIVIDFIPGVIFLIVW